MADSENTIAPGPERRKEAEAALSQREDQYRLLFETMSQGVVYQSAEGCIISANPAAARILGLTPGQLMGKTSYDPGWRAVYEDGSDFPADDHPAMVSLKTAKPVRDVVMGIFNTADDTYHWLKINAEPLFRPGEDKPYQVYTTFEDISDRQLSFKALQESESRLTAILENTQDAIWSADSEYRLLAANNPARQLYNLLYGATLVEGMDIRPAMTKEKGNYWSEAGGRVFNGERVVFENHYDLYGGPVDFEFSLSPMISPSGRVTGAFCMARDITARKGAAIKLAESEDLFRKAVQSTSDIVWNRDILSGHLEWFGDIDSMLGYAPGEFPRTIEAWEGALHPDDHDRVMAALSSHTETGEPYNVEYRMLHKHGLFRHWIDRGSVILDEGGRVVRMVGACVDITEHRQTEARARVGRDLALKLLDTVDLEITAQLCLEAAINISGFDSGVVYILDEKSGDFKAVYHCGISAYLEERYSVLKADSKSSRLLRKGLPFYVKAEEFTPPFDELLKPERFTFHATIPVLHQDRVIASLGVYSHTQDNLPDVVRDSLETIAADIGIFIDRIKSRQALQASEEKYRLVVENAREGIIVAQDGKIKFANRTTPEQLGYTPEELSSISFIDLVHPDDRRMVIERHLRRLKGEVFEDVCAFRVVRRDGRVAWVELQAVLIEWEGKDATLNFLTDITVRRQAEEKLNQRAALLDAAYDSIIAYDPEGKIIYANETACSLRGYTKEEMLAMNMRQLVPQEELPRLDERQKQLAEQGELSCEGVQVKKNGSVFLVDTHLRLVELAGHKLTIAAHRDITARKQMEKFLIANEARYRSLFEHNPVAVYSVDRQGRFTSANAAAMRLTGYSEEEALTLSMADVVAADYIDTMRAHFQDSLRGEPQSYESAINAKDGQRIDIYITSTPIVIDGGIVGTYGIAEDISGRKKAALDLKAALEHVEAALESTLNAIATMSELRDPYTAGHQKRVTQLALAIAGDLGLPADRVETLRVAGLLHDVGKVYVPAEILSKPGKLSELEFGLAKAHAEAGYDVVRTIVFPGPIAQIVRQHHERLDGSGYPQGLSGDQIMQEAKILAVADVVEAMMSHRPYRPALGMDIALEEISRNRGLLYDEQVTDACICLLREKGFKFQADSPFI